ncbi:TPA: phage antirepressor N-terminal domain-containing protein [Stenotrophomonas maltophilia]|uniref:phage antirepressor N-terminal domain-containing protein n=1 Tax=Stenotrophomonas maltophilia TaxID=40324 RepID=UPI002A948B66|nr:phage antirepressor N-terminal domain-containing protein [Stenotrophomonas maltophilia]HEL3760452.1 phage antirepressor N-terminal domain-containing protein [Stenotrophomonas maltophilia]
MNALTVQVEFAGATLLGKIKDGKPFVAMKPVVEGMGLSWQKQLEKMQSHPVLKRQLYTLRGMTGADGKAYAMACLPLDRLAFWLATVNPLKVADSIRDRVILFQEEAADVLHAAFTAARQGQEHAEVEYRPGYHALHDGIKEKCAGSPNERWVHANVNKAVNKAAGIESGMRNKLAPIERSTVVVLQQVATNAFAESSDHREGYQKAKARMAEVAKLLDPPKVAA